MFLQTRTRFWEKHHLTGSAQTNLPIMLIFSAYPRPGQRGILECYTSGENAGTSREWLHPNASSSPCVNSSMYFPSRPNSPKEPRAASGTPSPTPWAPTRTSGRDSFCDSIRAWPHRKAGFFRRRSNHVVAGMDGRRDRIRDSSSRKTGRPTLRLWLPRLPCEGAANLLPETAIIDWRKTMPQDKSGKMLNVIAKSWTDEGFKKSCSPIRKGPSLRRESMCPRGRTSK